MNNKTLNKLVVKGSAIAIESIFDKSDFSLNMLKAVPDEIAEVKSSSGANRAELEKLFGAGTAAEWRLANWGIKYDIEGSAVDLSPVKGDMKAEVIFETPQGYPISSLVDYFAEKNIDFKIAYAFADFKKNESEMITWEMGERLDEQYASCSRSDLIAFGLVAGTDEDDEDEDSELEELGEPGFGEDDPDEDEQ